MVFEDDGKSLRGLIHRTALPMDRGPPAPSHGAESMTSTIHHNLGAPSTEPWWAWNHAGALETTARHTMAPGCARPPWHAATPTEPGSKGWRTGSRPIEPFSGLQAQIRRFFGPSPARLPRNHDCAIIGAKSGPISALLPRLRRLPLSVRGSSRSRSYCPLIRLETKAVADPNPGNRRFLLSFPLPPGHPSAAFGPGRAICYRSGRDTAHPPLGASYRPVRPTSQPTDPCVSP
jgi:hypothetical protein